jgi:hypothetical protein
MSCVLAQDMAEIENTNPYAKPRLNEETGLWEILDEETGRVLLTNRSVRAALEAHAKENRRIFKEVGGEAFPEDGSGRFWWHDVHSLPEEKKDKIFDNTATIEDAGMRGVDLRGADLRGARFLGGSFDQSNLEDVLFSGAQFIGMDFRGAKLSGADLQKTVLFALDDFQGADLQGADLRGAYLVGARLREADLTGARINRVDLRDSDISRAQRKSMNLEGYFLHPSEIMYIASAAVYIVIMLVSIRRSQARKGDKTLANDAEKPALTWRNASFALRIQLLLCTLVVCFCTALIFAPIFSISWIKTHHYVPLIGLIAAIVYTLILQGYFSLNYERYKDKTQT